MPRKVWPAVLLAALLSPLSLAAQTDAGAAGLIGDTRGGRVTASGEVYDPQAFTAGHPSLRFGIRLAVTNPANGAVVTVRVNDRGTFPEGRLINLSRAAAQALGLEAPGPVTVRALKAGEPDVAVAAAPVPVPVVPAAGPETTFVPLPRPPQFLQIGAYRTLANAARHARQAAAQGFEPLVRKDKALYRVYLSADEGGLAALAERVASTLKTGYFQLSTEPPGTLVKVPTE